MKKLSYILLCLPLIFNSCKKEEDSKTIANINSQCGNVNITVDGINQNYNPILASCTTSNILNSNFVVLNFNSYCSGSLGQPDYVLQLQLSTSITINQTYSISGTPGLSPYPILGFNLMSCSPSSAVLYANSNMADVNGDVTFTNIDASNNTIDGNLSFTGYNHPNTSNFKTITCTFSNVPFISQ